ncbi:MAG: permease prefix domain 1-containing protein [Oligoflexia bacterium]|nr:permease prefix domain 1-containing protein [Oligoflexia bacterium]
MRIADDPGVQAFLKEACRKIRSRRAREEIRDELVGHLEDSVAAKLQAGIGESEAIAQALAEIGSPRELAGELAVAHRPLFLQWPFLAAALGLVSVIGVLALTHLANTVFERVQRRYQESIAGIQDRFLRDQALLRAEPVFAFAGSQRDAGARLNLLLPWEGAVGFSQSERDSAASLAIPEALRRKLQSPDWLEATADSSAFETAWLGELSGFDHWDLFRSGPLKTYLEQNPDAAFWILPVPDYAVLRDWAKIRLLKGIHDGNVLPALREVRHLARLVYSNELLVSDMIAVSMLRDEAAAYRSAVSKRLLSASDWKPLSEEFLIRAKRALWGHKHFLNLWADPDLMKRLFDGRTATVGMCSAFSENLSGLIMHRAFLSTSLPWESDLSARFELLDSLIRQSRGHCRMSEHFLSLWREPERSRSWLKPANFLMSGLTWQEFLFVYLPRVPVFRRWAWAELMAPAIPNYLTGPYRSNLLPGEARPPEPDSP